MSTPAARSSPSFCSCQLRARAGLGDLRFHDLRHTTASLLLSAGVHPKIVQERLGHSTIAGPAFPRFNHVYAEAEDVEELVTATLSFEKLHRWESVFPWRDWRATHQSETSELIAEEFRKLARGS